MERDDARTEPESGLPADDDFDDSMGEGGDLDDLSFSEEEIATATGASPAPAAPAPSPTPAAAPPTGAPSEPAAGTAKPAPGASPTPQPSAAPAAGAAPTTDAPPTGPRPFTVRADRTAHAFEGAEEREDGLFVPKGPTLDRVRDLIASGIAHHGSFQRTLKQLHERAATAERTAEQERARVDEEIVRAKAQNQFWADLYEQGPDAVAAHLDEFGKTRTLIEARMERELAKREREEALRLRNGGAPSVAPAASEGSAPAGDKTEVDDTVLRSNLGELVEDLVATVPEFAVLTEQDRKELTEYLGAESMLPQVFFVAGRDIPEMNVFKGDVIADRDVLHREATRIARIRRETAEAAAAAARNSGRVRPAGAPPSPNGGGERRGTEEPSGKGAKRTFKSKAEFDQYFNETPTEQLIADYRARRST